MPKRKRVNKKLGRSVQAVKKSAVHAFWQILGSGNYNNVYVHKEADEKLLDDSEYTGPWVYKKKKPDEDKDVNALNEASRSVRLFKEIHPDKAVGLFRNGWVAPFFKGEKPSDHELVEGILKVYRQTRRIVMDAPGGNFISVDGAALCVDVDMALRRNSVDSINYWLGGGRDSFHDYWSHFEKHGYPQAVNIIRNLIYLEDNLSSRAILDEYICDNIISSLTYFRLNGLKITVTQLDAFLFFYRSGDSIQAYIDKQLNEKTSIPERGAETSVVASTSAYTLKTG